MGGEFLPNHWPTENTDFLEAKRGWYKISQFKQRMYETLIVGKFQRSILNRLRKPSLFNYFHPKEFSFLSLSVLVLLFENMLPQLNAYVNIRIIACFFE